MRVTSQKKHKLCSEPPSERGYEVVFHVYHTNQTLGKRGLRKSPLKCPPSTSNNASYKPKKPENCSEPLSERDYEVVFHVNHTNQTLGKRGLRKSLLKRPPSTSNNASYKQKKTRKLLGTTERKRLCGPFPCISHKSNPWKTGTTKVYKNTPFNIK